MTASAAGVELDVRADEIRQVAKILKALFDEAQAQLNDETAHLFYGVEMIVGRLDGIADTMEQESEAEPTGGTP